MRTRRTSLMVVPTLDGTTRLISRWRPELAEDAGFQRLDRAVRPGAFVMERRMLRTIRDLAERSPTSASYPRTRGGVMGVPDASPNKGRWSLGRTPHRRDT